VAACGHIARWIAIGLGGPCVFSTRAAGVAARLRQLYWSYRLLDEVVAVRGDLAETVR
jgi:hypothetical protein